MLSNIKKSGLKLNIIYNQGVENQFALTGYGNFKVTEPVLMSFVYNDESSKQYIDPRGKFMFYTKVKSSKPIIDSIGDNDYCNSCAKTLKVAYSPAF